MVSYMYNCNNEKRIALLYSCTLCKVKSLLLVLAHMFTVSKMMLLLSLSKKSCIFNNHVCLQFLHFISRWSRYILNCVDDFSLKPFHTNGNGNCFYSFLSVIVTGGEESSVFSHLVQLYLVFLTTSTLYIA